MIICSLDVFKKYSKNKEGNTYSNCYNKLVTAERGQEYKRSG